MSVSRMRDSDAERFSTATPRLLTVCSRRFWTAPNWLRCEEAVDLRQRRLHFGVGGGPGLGVLGAVGSLHGQVTHTLQQRRGLVQGAFSGLEHADAVLGILHGHLEATHLGAQLLADRQAGGV